MPEISIIMPIYNSESTLENTLNSLINQTFTKKYEVILINDGSKDNTDKICEKFSEKYSFIKYKKIPNGGVSNARNTGIEMSTGKYIMFIDSDDTYSETALEVMHNHIESSDVDLVMAGYNRINENTGRVVTISIDNSIYDKKDFNKVIQRGQSNNYFNQLWNKIYKTKIIKDNNLKFNTKLSLGEDYQFILNYIKLIDKVEISNEVIYNYINSTTGLNNKYRKDRLDINIENMKLLEEFYKDNNFDMTYVNKKYIITFLSGINNICKNKNKKERNEELTKFVNNAFIKEKLSIKINFKFNLLCWILKRKSIHVLAFLGKLLKLYDTTYKKIKLGY